MGITCNPIAFLRRISAWALEPSHPVVGAPFIVEHLGYPWAVAASRTFGVALRLTNAPLPPLDGRAVNGVRHSLFPGILASGSAPGNSLADLKAWAGPVDWPVPEACPACGGGENHPACDFCSGVGRVVRSHEERPGWLGEVLIDRAFLAWVLSPFDDEMVAVCTRGQRSPLHIVGQSWIATVIPRADHAEQKDAPSLFMVGIPVDADARKAGASS